jgi:hypothetical protein
MFLFYGKQSVCITITGRLILFLQRFALLSVTRTEYIHALCGQNVTFILMLFERLVVNESVSLFFNEELSCVWQPPCKIIVLNDVFMAK